MTRAVSAVVVRLHHCARKNIPVAVAVRVRSSGRVTTVRGVVAEVAIDSFVVKTKLGQRFAARAEDVIAITRADGRPFRDRTDAREQLRDAADEHADAGGLE